MALPSDFHFSQGSLQDYADCPRRFLLRHIQHRSWPAVETEPVQENERLMRQGSLFHRLVHQHLLGIATQQLARNLSDPDLEAWWNSFAAFSQNPGALEGISYPEITLTDCISGYNLIARYDLILFAPGGKALIFDWKTSHKRPTRRYTAERLQTRIYPFLLAQAGADLNGGGPPPPEKIEMVYWFAAFPDQPECFPYSSTQFAADQAYLSALIDEISRMDEQDFQATDGPAACRYCVYRSLCDRGVQAGGLDERQDSSDHPNDGPANLDFEFDQQIEIAF